MNTIKAIETHYGGRRYRSRLEARWAVFFNYLSIPFDYEPEGFELPSGRYLPDFWMPSIDAWVEIKPTEPTAREMRLVHELCEITDKKAFIFCQTFPSEFDSRRTFGIQSPAAHYVVTFQDEGRTIYGGDNYFYWCECPKCGALDIQFDGRSDRIDCRREGGKCHDETVDDKGYNWGSHRLRMAMNEALSARFEFGR